jgi:hypothetical protein
MPFTVRNRWYLAAAAVAIAAFAAHEALGAARILSQLAAPPADSGAVVLAFNLWTSAASLLLILATAFLAAAILGRTPLLAGAATLISICAATLPALFVGFHGQPVLATLQILAFGAMAALGLMGLWRSRGGPAHS